MARSTILYRTAGAGRRRRRRILSYLLIVLAVVAVLVAAGLTWLQRALPRIAAAEIGRMVDARIEMGAVHLGLDGSVAVMGLAIRSQARERHTDDAILRAERVEARFSRRSLLALSPRVTEIRIEDFLLDARLDLDTGRWNFEALRSNAPRGGGGGGGLPALHLQRGTLRYSQLSGAQPQVVRSLSVEARFGRDVAGDPSYGFEIRTSASSDGRGGSHLTGRWRPCLGPAGSGSAPALPGELTLTGRLSSADVPVLEQVWTIDALIGELQYNESGNYSLKLTLKDLHGRETPAADTLPLLAPGAEGAELLRSLQTFLAEYQPTGAVESITLTASGNTGRLDESRIDGKLVCRDISVCDISFPYRIDHLRGELDFTQSTLRLQGLKGRHGTADICIDGWARGFSSDRQYQYRITSPNMVLDEALYAALDPQEKRLWDTFRPTGTVAVDYRLTRTLPTDKRLSLTVDLNDVTAAYQEFPYPLVGLTGRLFFDHKSIVLSEVVSRSGGRHIQVDGKVTDPVSSRPVYYLSIEGRDIPLDTTLRDALPPQHRELFRRFDLNGLADIRGRIFSPGETSGAAVSPPAGSGDSDAVPHLSFLVNVSCREGSLKLPGQDALATKEQGQDARDAEQPLVVSNITAEATITPDSLSIRRLEGRHGQSPVTLTGSVQFGEDDRLRQCHMKITARQVPLAEAAVDLLPSSLKEPAAAFYPEGDVNLVVELKKADGAELPEYSVAVECLGNRIRHERFAYPLQDIRGTVLFAQDNIVLKDITVRPLAEEPETEDGRQTTVPSSVLRPPSSVLRVEGSAQVAGGRLETGTFTLQATDLRFTEALGCALPPTLTALYREAAPAGSFDLAPTTLTVSRYSPPDARPGAAEDEILVEFDGKAKLGHCFRHPTVAAGGAQAPCRLTVSGAPLELSGVLEVQGSYGSRRGLTRGRARLAAEQLVVRGKAITNTNIEGIYDPNARTWAAADFVGRCYGGRLLGNLQIGSPLPLRERQGTGEERRDPGDSQLEYLLQVAFDDVDLQQFLEAGPPQDRGQKTEDGKQRTEDGRQKTADAGARTSSSSVLRPPSSGSSGTLDAWLSLHTQTGASSAAMARRGVLLVEIANMQVGKVSPLGTILSVLRLNEPTDYLFDGMLIESYLRGDKLLIPRLALSGRSTAFAGSGTMDLSNDEINLTLTARNRPVAAGAGGPSALQRVRDSTAVFQSLTEGLTGAMVRMEVTGTAGSPRVQTKALPVIEDSLKLLGTPEESRKGKK